MKKYKNRILSFVAVMIFFITGLSQDITGNRFFEAKASTEEAYSNTDGKNTSQDTLADQLQSGKRVYKEETIDLPKLDFSAYETILGMLCNPDSLCEVITCKINKVNSNIYDCQRYTLVNGEWKKTPINWNDTFGAVTTTTPTYFQYSPNGELYCISSDILDYKAQTYLTKISDGGTVKIIDVPALSTKTNGSYPQISSFTVTKKDLFIFSKSAKGIYEYDLKSGKLVISNDNATVGKIVSVSNTISYVDLLYGSLITIDDTTGEQINEVLLDADPYSEAGFNQLYSTNLLTDGNDVYTVSTKGVYKFQGNKSVCLLGEYANQITLPSNHSKLTSMSKDGSFYLLGYEDGSYYIKHYVLTDTANLKYNDTFTLAVYDKNDRVSEAIMLFAKAHPDVKVEIIQMSSYDSPQLQRINLEKADAIVFGNEAYPTIKSFGLFKELSSTAQSLVKSQGLYNNIIDTAYEKNKLYAIPIEFIPYIYAGNKTILKNVKTLSSLQKYSSKTGNAIWQGMGYQTLGHVAYQFLYPMLTNEDGSWNKNGVKAFFNSLKKTSSIDINDTNYTEYDWYNYFCYNNYVNHKESLLATEIDEAIDLKVLLYFLKQTGGTYQCSGAFEVNNYVGINKNADTNLTNDFLSILYGKNAQSTSIGKGLPLRIGSLDEWVNNGEARYLSDSNNNSILINAPLTNNDISNFKNMLNKITKIVRYNDSQAVELAMNIQLYMNGTGSVDDAVDRIVNRAE